MAEVGGFDEEVLLGGNGHSIPAGDVPEGARNSALFTVLNSVGHWYNDNRLTPSLPDKELEATIRSAFARHHQNGKENVSSSPMLDVSLGELDEPPPREWLIDQLIPAGCVSSLFGPGDTAKSYVALYIAMHVAMGRPCLGQDTKQGAALYLDAELDVDELTRRAYAVARGLGLERPPADLRYASIRALDDGVDSLVQRRSPLLVILDSLTIALYALDASAQSVIVPRMQRLREWGTVLAVDHTPKSVDQVGTQFGSVFKRNLVRSSFHVESLEGAYTMDHDKHNFSRKFPAVYYALRFSGSPPVVRLEQHERANTTYAGQRILAELAKAGTLSADDLAERVGTTKKTTQNLLSLMFKDGILQRSGHGKYTLP